MSCEKFELELFESFGTTILTVELTNHLESCTSCKEIYNNLQSAESEIGTDENFFESNELVNKRVEAVNREIDTLELTKVLSPAKWKSFVPMAAAIFLVVGIGLIAKFALSFSDQPKLTESNDIEMIFISLTDDDTKSLNEIELSELIDDYATEYRLDNEMLLLDDLSDEEYKYLEENLNIGEIL